MGSEMCIRDRFIAYTSVLFYERKGLTYELLCFPSVWRYTPQGWCHHPLISTQASGGKFVKGGRRSVPFTLDKLDDVSYTPKANDDQNKKNLHIPNAQCMQTESPGSFS